MLKLLVDYSFGLEALEIRIHTSFSTAVADGARAVQRQRGENPTDAFKAQGFCYPDGSWETKPEEKTIV